MVDRARLLAYDTGTGGGKAVLTDLQGRVLHSAYCPYPVHIALGRWILAGEMETGGGALIWFREEFWQEESRQAEQARLSTYQVLSQMVDTVEPGADRLLFAPWLSGERAPVLNHHARGAWNGLTLSHTRAHPSRAVMEGVAYPMRWICEAIEALGSPIGALNSIGGGCTRPLRTQILSDVMGRRSGWWNTRSRPAPWVRRSLWPSGWVCTPTWTPSTI